jgi:hypothetical protein
MSRAPSARDGIDAATLQAVNASHEASDAVRVEQNEQADVAERAGHRMNLALLLSALTLSLAALAATGRGARMRGIDRVAATVLAASLAVALSAVLA